MLKDASNRTKQRPLQYVVHRSLSLELLVAFSAIRRFEYGFYYDSPQSNNKPIVKT